MTEEELNKEKRKFIPLTTSESLIFFFIPIVFFGSRMKKNNDYNESEIERFKRFGFDLKTKQAKELMLYGRFFYFGLFAMIMYLLKY